MSSVSAWHAPPRTNDPSHCDSDSLSPSQWCVAMVCALPQSMFTNTPECHLLSTPVCHSYTVQCCASVRHVVGAVSLIGWGLSLQWCGPQHTSCSPPFSSIVQLLAAHCTNSVCPAAKIAGLSADLITTSDTALCFFLSHSTDQ